MTEPFALHRVIGAERAIRVISHAAHRIAEQDMLPEQAALALARERLARCDPYLLAAPGQEWQMAQDTVLLPTQRIAVDDRIRTSTETKIVLRPLDGSLEGQLLHLPPRALDGFELDSWHTAEPDVDYVDLLFGADYVRSRSSLSGDEPPR